LTIHHQYPIPIPIPDQPKLQLFSPSPFSYSSTTTTIKPLPFNREARKNPSLNPEAEPLSIHPNPSNHEARSHTTTPRASKTGATLILITRSQEVGIPNTEYESSAPVSRHRISDVVRAVAERAIGLRVLPITHAEIMFREKKANAVR